MKRGDIFFVDFEPARGAEIKKKRPALIVSCDEANRHLRTVLVIPFSSKTETIYPFEVLVTKEESGLPVDSKLKIPQMRAVDKARLTRYAGTVREETMEAVEKAIKLHLAMD
ncbi:MAG: type II toxin-antitoxin system PemK/MazF family toxin [Thermodesulfobacteriota bacterium]